MSDYTKSTNFATKDSLPSGNAAKIVKGTEINTEFDNIATAVATKANKASPAFTGTMSLAGTALTATFSELNILDGVTATAAELNTLDGITATVSELNTLDGITATVTELNYTDGVTSAIQTQLDNKQPLDADLTAIAALANTDGNIIVGNGTAWVAESGATARASLGLTIGTDVQAYSSVLAATTASFTTADETKLDGIETGATADQTASEILTAIKTVDGAGSGLDADLLDGNEATAFATAAQGTLADSALQSSDIGSSIQAYDSNLTSFVTTFTLPTTDSTAGYILQTNGAGTLSFVAQSGYDESTVAITGGTIDGTAIGSTTPSTGSFSSLNVGGSDVVVDTDIGVTVQGYDADTAKYDDVTANFTGTLQNGGSNVLVDSDIGSTIQAYDATIVVDADIGVSVQAYDADTTKNDVANTFTAVQTFDNGIIEEYTAVTSTTNATTCNMQDGTNFSHTLTENTTFTFSNPASSGKVSAFTLKIVQDASASGYTVTWPTSVDWPSATAPTLTATASAVDYFVFITHDGGTTWYGFTAGQGMA
jgi:hypothetical protein